MTLSMVVDKMICQGHGLCQREAPDVFELRDDMEFAVVLIDPIPEHRVVAAHRALEGCPEQAIREVNGRHRS